MIHISIKILPNTIVKYFLFKKTRNIGDTTSKIEDYVTDKHSATYQYNENNQLVKEDDITYSYDDNGNLKEKNSAEETVEYFYDAENHLTRVETTRFGVTIVVEYEYDAEGNRVRKVLDGTLVTNYLVDTNRDYAQVLEERDGNGNLLVRYVYGHDLISQTRGGATTYYHYDGLGSTRALTASSEAVTDTYTYDVFGNLLDKTGSTTNDYLYTGEFFDSNIGFYYLRARYMNPAIGRFVTMDTFAGRNRDPYSLHKYLYAHANPVNLVDPSGMMSDYNQVVISGAIIGALSGIYVYHVTHAPEERTVAGYANWAAGGALIGGLLAHGAWYITLYTSAAATGGLTAAQAEFLRRGQYAKYSECVKAANEAKKFFKGDVVQVMDDIRVHSHYVLKLRNGWIIDSSYVGNLKEYAKHKISQGLMTQQIVDEAIALVGNRNLFSPAEYEELLVVLEAAMRYGYPKSSF